MTNEELAETIERLAGAAEPLGNNLAVQEFHGPREITCENVKIGGPAKVFDVRGWGYLTGKGHGGLGLSEDEALAIQTANTTLIVTLVNNLPSILSALRGREECTWSADDDGNFNTTCGHTFTLEYDGPTENQMKFCCYCGGDLIDQSPTLKANPNV